MVHLEIHSSSSYFIGRCTPPYFILCDPRRGTSCSHRTSQSKTRATEFVSTQKVYQKEPQGKGQHLYAVSIPSSAKRPNYDPTKFCTHHNKKWHSTEEYRTTAKMLAINLASEGKQKHDTKDDFPSPNPTLKRRGRRSPEEESLLSPSIFQKENRPYFQRT